MKRFSCLIPLLSLLVGLVVLHTPSGVRAAEDEATLNMARERFREGVRYYDQKQYDKARAAFLQAYALKAHPAVLLNLAQSELKSEREADAAKHFAQFLREADDAAEEERATAEAGLESAKLAVAEVTLEVPDGAAVYVDGQLEARAPLAGPVYLSPGEHRLEAKRGDRTAEESVIATAGENLSLSLSFPPSSTVAPAHGAEAGEDYVPVDTGVSASSESFFGWFASTPLAVAGGVIAVAGLGAGIGFGLAAQQSYDNASSIDQQITDQSTLVDMVNPVGLCTPGVVVNLAENNPQQPGSDVGITPQEEEQYKNACAKYEDAVDEGDSRKVLATVGFAVGGVALVGTIVYYFVDRSSGGDETARSVYLVPSVGPGFQGLSLIGRF